MNKIKKLIQEAILLAINSVSEDIQKDARTAENMERAEIIKTLAEAYATVSGKGKGKA